ncbi:MAG TPA: TIGR03013 family XrtA/PEP-CTERM system glycosyltransferase [Gammaproteobacteria bacterium]|nr:TIGR03013 family XrtA/PEP-CTERM system glycosyltransferase [Gammaproteobacteria bacterium]
MRVLNHHVPLPTLVAIVYEFVAAAASVYAAGFLRFGTDWPAEGDLHPSLPKALLFGAATVVGLAAMGLYQNHYRRLSREAIVARIFIALSVAALAEAVIFFLLPVFAQGRGIWILSAATTFVLVVLGRYVLSRFLSEDAFRRRIVIYGAGNMAASLLALRRRSDQRGFRIVAFVPTAGDRFVIDDGRVLNSDVDLVDLVEREDVHEIVVAMDDKRQGFPMADLLRCKFAGVDVIEIIGFLERESGKVDVERLNPSWLVFSEGFTRTSARQVASRALDLVGGLLLLAVAWPFMILVAVAILIEDGSPVLYRQTRVGLLGRPFELLKFRSMTKEAEAAGAQWAQKGDTRVTKVGKIIRKVRFDELPQVFNIVRGQMSLVGPRPERPEFVDSLARKIPYYQERHCVKPGLTGWAQLQYPYGASEKDALEKLRYDLYYVKNQSFLLDLIILLQTAEVVIWQKGSR